MKQKFSLKLLAVLLVGCFFALPGLVSAGGGTNHDPVEASASATSAVANNTSTITITAYTYRYGCPDGYTSNTPTCGDGSTSTTKVGTSGKTLGIFTSASDLTYGSTQSWGNGVHYVTTGSDGKATFTVASSAAGSKEIKIAVGDNGEMSGTETAVLNLSFTAPPAATTTPKKTTPSPSATTPAPAAEPTPPETPKVATLEVAGQPVAATETIELAAAESLVLKGTTVANGIVKLYIFSTPREVTVTADASGNWTYEVKDLESGSHHVEAEVTDPATSKTSTRATLASFTVAEPETAAVAAAPARKKTSWLIVVGAILLVVLAGTVTWWWRKRQNHPAQPPTPPAPDNNDDSTPAPPVPPVMPQA